MHHRMVLPTACFDEREICFAIRGRSHRLPPAHLRSGLSGGGSVRCRGLYLRIPPIPDVSNSGPVLNAGTALWLEAGIL